MDYRNRPKTPRELLHWYALFNMKSTTYGPCKCYPADTQIFETLPEFPNVDGFKITASLSDHGRPELGNDWVVEYNV